MDVVSKDLRSKIMSNIRGRDTTPEKDIRKALHHAGFRYRACSKKYPGTPDIVLPKYYSVIFINGCFWHGHSDCSLFHFPKSNQKFWIKKISRNCERDRQIIKHYKDKCWNVCVVWECAIRGNHKKQKIEGVVRQIIMWLEETKESFLEIRSVR